MDKLAHIAGRCLTHTECRLADLDNVEGLQGNDCRLKKWYRRKPQTNCDMLSFFGRAGAILLGVVDVSHALFA